MKLKQFISTLTLSSTIFVAAACQGDGIGNNGFISTPVNDEPIAEKYYYNVVDANGQLAVQNQQLVNEDGGAVMLRGISYGWHNWWPRFYNEQSVYNLAHDWHATVVRASMGVDEENCYIDDPETAINCVTSVVDGAIKAGIYVLIDWHCHHIKTDEAVDFFTLMANKYKDYPNVIYEIYNEPTDVSNWEDVKVYSIKLIETIRAIDKDNIILVGTPHWDTDVALAVADPITGFDNIMYTFHFYAATHKDGVRAKAQAGLDGGLPLFVSECAYWEATGSGLVDLDSWGKWVTWMESNKISYITWCLTDDSMLTKSASSTGPWDDSELTQGGIDARTETLKNWSEPTESE